MKDPLLFISGFPSRLIEQSRLMQTDTAFCKKHYFSLTLGSVNA